MNKLILDNKPWKYIRIGIGILSLIAGFSYFLANRENLIRLDYLLTLGFSITGLIHITNDFGMQKTALRQCENSLIIKWINKFKTQEILYAQIESIYLKKTEVIINQKNHKILKLRLLIFRTDQKRAIYEFFINLAKMQNLDLTRQFS